MLHILNLVGFCAIVLLLHKLYTLWRDGTTHGG